VCGGGRSTQKTAVSVGGEVSLQTLAFILVLGRRSVWVVGTGTFAGGEGKKCLVGVLGGRGAMGGRRGVEIKALPFFGASAARWGGF